jgi:hypothetical protein
MKSVQEESSRKLHGHNVIKKNYLTKTFNFDHKLKIDICKTENNEEKAHVITYFSS